MKRFVWILGCCLLFCSACQPGPGSWQAVSNYNEHHNIMTAGFLNEQFAITGGVGGEMHYSIDSGLTWPDGKNTSDCRYGMEIVSPKIAWTCGGQTHVRSSLDGGKTWQAVTNFGDYQTTRTPCHAMSFHDEKVGWLANYEVFGTTQDGGQTWQTPALPDGAGEIATLDTFAPARGYLLDMDGDLFLSQDDGIHWSLVSRLPWQGFSPARSVYQVVAMRFSDLEHGLVAAWLVDGKKEKMISYRTTDAGRSWQQVEIPVAAGPLYLSRDLRLLTVISGPNMLSLLRYLP